MAFFQDAFDRVKQMTNNFLNGREVQPARASYYADEDDAQAYAAGMPQVPPPAVDSYQQQPYQQQQPYHQSVPYQQPVRQETQMQNAPSNVSYFPNATFTNNAGENFVHIERVAQMLSREDVHTVVSFMMNKESVIISCESIASAQEVQRCIDLISGAAYALGCQITQLSLTAKVFLVSPNSVCVMLDESSQRMNGRNNDGSPLRSRSARRNTRNEQATVPVDQPYDRRGEYQEYQPYQEEPQPQEQYGRPSYYSAMM